MLTFNLDLMLLHFRRYKLLHYVLFAKALASLLLLLLLGFEELLL